MSMNQKTNWIEPLGGVLVIIDHETAKAWNGVEGDDYEFACSFADYTSVAVRHSKPIVVLGDESLRTGLLRINSDLLLIIRWVYAAWLKR